MSQTSPAVAAAQSPEAVVVDKLYTGFTTLFPPKPIRVEAADINPLPAMFDMVPDGLVLNVLTIVSIGMAVLLALMLLFAIFCGVSTAAERFRAYLVYRRGLALKGLAR